MKISKNEPKEKTETTPDIPLGAAGGVHSSDDVYLQVKKLLGIPSDEPIFILRAQDKFAVDLISAYRKRVRDGIGGNGKNIKKSDSFFAWYENVGSIINDFINWRNSRKNQVKVPD